MSKVWIKPLFEGSDGKPLLRETVDAREAVKSGAYELVDEAAQGFDDPDKVDAVSQAAAARAAKKKG
jgi:hypothetical protein